MKYLVIGLGNIGDEYANTRHNVGFIVLDAIAREAETKFSSGRYGDVLKVKYKGRILVLVKPSTYMNLSGKAVRYWMEKEKIQIENVLVVTDDLALPLGSLRMKQKGGAGGHNGLSSIIEYLNTEEFPRLRVGIGDDFSLGYQTDYVLGQWTKEEEEVMIPKIKTAVEMVRAFVTIGINRTMTLYNKK